ncbi:hypothetical protein NC651_001032 [Populus alba x Populus x berolinensis]|nr:hypothetical protein NC651_001032 [Populus alba x Populus x berolinensis]
MHGVARVVEMFDQYSDELFNCPESKHTGNFLMDEIRVLDDAKAIALPNFLPRHAFLSLLQRKVESHTENYPQVLLTTKRACQNLMEKMREQSTDWVSELVEMEKLTDYTCNPEYLKEWNMLMSHRQTFLDDVQEWNKSSKMVIQGFGVVEIDNLNGYQPLLSQAYDLKMRMTAYWKIVSRRMVDCMALHLQLCVRNLVSKELEKEIVTELMATKRKRLNASIELLREAKDVLSNIMGNVSA